jgi:group II intron reverse transcriptase/maturase
MENAIHRDWDTWTRLSRIASRAREDKEFKFTSVMHLMNEKYLRDCFYSLKKNKAVGVDDVSWQEYEKELGENIQRLVGKLKSRKYKPKPAKRVYIPKSNKEKRPLGISALENKVVEKGMTNILQSIYEQDFLDCSYGFRPKRNCHQALKEVGELIMSKPVNHIVEADIKGFFDNVDHEKLMELIQRRVKDTPFLNLIRKFLKAGYVENGMLERTDKGTPQGSIMSPMLANIFLHYVLDKWYEEKVKRNVRGYCELVRYADDFICLVQYKEEAKRIEQGLKKRFEKYGLEIHPKKSRTITFGRFEKENAARQDRKPNTFDFLGFTHYCDKTRKGNFKVGRKTSRDAFVAKCKEMGVWLKTTVRQRKIKEWWGILKAKLSGHYQYYGISENYRGVKTFYMKTIRMVLKWMNRRSQKNSMNWENFTEYLKHYPLPKPRIVKSFYV